VKSCIGLTPVCSNAKEDSDAYGGVEGVLNTLDVEEGLESTHKEEGLRVVCGRVRQRGGPRCVRKLFHRHCSLPTET